MSNQKKKPVETVIDTVETETQEAHTETSVSRVSLFDRVELFVADSERIAGMLKTCGRTVSATDIESIDNASHLTYCVLRDELKHTLETLPKTVDAKPLRDQAKKLRGMINNARNVIERAGFQAHVKARHIDTRKSPTWSQRYAKGNARTKVIGQVHVLRYTV